jgi:hypothetical protein
MQAMVTKELAEEVGGLKKLVSTGTAVLVEGELTETPEGTKQVGFRTPCSFMQTSTLKGLFVTFACLLHQTSTQGIRDSSLSHAYCLAIVPHKLGLSATSLDDPTHLPSAKPHQSC